jgi:beta-galactosidase
MSLARTNSPYSVAETMERMVAAIESRGITVFARVDHATGAREAGLELADEQVVIFGDPRAGTLLMQEDPTIGYELPLRVLVWDDAGQTRIAYRPPPHLSGEFAVAGHAEVLARMAQLLEQLAAESVASGE